MKGYRKNVMGLLAVIILCFGVLAGCGDDKDMSPVSSAIEKRDPSYGFLLNSTPYRLVLDFEEQNRFRKTLEPGELISLTRQKNRTHLVHVVVMDEGDRAITDYVNSFYIDDYALDNQLRDFLCSWYVEFVSDSGFYNNFGS